MDPADADGLAGGIGAELAELPVQGLNLSQVIRIEREPEEGGSEQNGTGAGARDPPGQESAWDRHGINRNDNSSDRFGAAGPVPCEDVVIPS
jgi:hypothetical protein